MLSDYWRFTSKSLLKNEVRKERIPLSARVNSDIHLLWLLLFRFNATSNLMKSLEKL